MKIELQQYKYSSVEYEERFHELKSQSEMLNYNLTKKEQECETLKWDI